MKVTRGTSGSDRFETGSASETIVAADGWDSFTVNLDKLGPQTILNLMGEDGEDYFGMHGITSDLLQSATAERVNIYGGNGYDRADFYYEGEGGIHVQDILNTVSLHNIEIVAVGAFLTHGKAIGTDGNDNVLLASTDNQRSYLIGGAGSDRLLGAGENADAVIDGADGSDVITAYLQSGVGHAEARGGAGADFFVLNYAGRHDFNVLDFDRGSDHFLVSENYEGFFDLDPGEAKQNNHRFNKTIDFHDGTIFYKGHAYAEVEGVSHLSSADFLFL